jgi:hypothetical protein
MKSETLSNVSDYGPENRYSIPDRSGLDYFFFANGPILGLQPAWYLGHQKHFSQE